MNAMNEKVIEPVSGILMLFVIIAVGAISMFLMTFGVLVSGLLVLLGFAGMITGFVLLFGLKAIKPQEALVLTLFGKYTGTIKQAGFYFVNPFSVAVNPAAHTRLGQSGDVDGMGTAAVSVAADGKTVYARGSKKISLKIMTLNNSKQKVNDVLGNPVEIGIAVMWKVVDTSKAVFNVDNFKEYLSLQCDSAVRNIVRIYPYDIAQGIDTTGDGEPDEGSLRGSSALVAERIRQEIQQKVEEAGLEILEARITYLAYAPEIAAAMLQRQQASAIIDARKMIVDGAVGMVEMALEKLSENNVVELDEERPWCRTCSWSCAAAKMRNPL